MNAWLFFGSYRDAVSLKATLILWLLLKSVMGNACHPILSLDFLRRECRQGRFIDKASSKLLGDFLATREKTNCSCAHGVTQYQTLRSTENLRSLQSSLASASYAINLWLQPEKHVWEDRPILRIGYVKNCGYNLQVRSLNDASLEISTDLILGLILCSYYAYLPSPQYTE